MRSARAAGGSRVYLLLAAGSGTRMGALTQDRAKVLVEVDGRPILAHNLDAIDAADPDARILIVGGYAADAIEAFLSRRTGGTAAALLLNPDYRTQGPLRSIEIGLAALPADCPAVTIGNGDTIFEPAAIAALAAVPAPVALLASPAGPLDADDDVQLLVRDGAIAVAAKHLGAAGALPVSAGLLQLTGTPAVGVLRRAIQAGLAEEHALGRALTWHSVLARLAELSPRPVLVPRDSWWEFDSEADVLGYGRHRADPR